MSAAGPGVRLLAITPPRGAVDPDLVRAWEAARAVGLAVLLREPGTRPRALVDDAHRLAPLRRACATAGVPCLLSADPSALPELEDALRSPGLVGVQLRGDPDRAQLQAARRQLGPGVVLGRSCHGEPLALGPDVDYSVFAPVFPPRTTSPTPGPGKVAVGRPGRPGPPRASPTSSRWAGSRPPPPSAAWPLVPTASPPSAHSLAQRTRFGMMSRAWSPC